MVKRSTATALIILTAACRQAEDSTLLSCAPNDATLVAGVDVQEFRKWPVYARLPAGWRTALAPIEAAQSAIIAVEGRGLLVAARGPFAAAPAGAVMAAPDVALFGPADDVKSAAENYRKGHVAQTPLLSAAESVSRMAPVWLAVRGDAGMPLPANIASFVGILRKARVVTLTAQRTGAMEFHLRASAPDENAARAIEETLRADLTLAALAEAKRPDVAALLKKAEVTREGLMVDVRFSAPDDAAARLLGM